MFVFVQALLPFTLFWIYQCSVAQYNFPKPRSPAFNFPVSEKRWPNVNPSWILKLVTLDNCLRSQWCQVFCPNSFYHSGSNLHASQSSSDSQNGKSSSRKKHHSNFTGLLCFGHFNFSVPRSFVHLCYYWKYQRQSNSYIFKRFVLHHKKTSLFPGWIIDFATLFPPWCLLFTSTKIRNQMFGQRSGSALPSDNMVSSQSLWTNPFHSSLVNNLIFLSDGLFPRKKGCK